MFLLLLIVAHCKVPISFALLAILKKLAEFVLHSKLLAKIFVSALIVFNNCLQSFTTSKKIFLSFGSNFTKYCLSLGMLSEERDVSISITFKLCEKNARNLHFQIKQLMQFKFNSICDSKKNKVSE